jgi:hypothetical protein
VKQIKYSFRALGILILVILCVFPFFTKAQKLQEIAPGGESMSESFRVGDISITYNNKRFHADSDFQGDTLDWTPPTGRDIDFVVLKEGKEGGDKVIIFLDDGSIYVFEPSVSSNWSIGSMELRSRGYPPFTKVEGDALYGLASTGVTYVSRDTAATWQIDTTGLGTGYPFDIGLDTLQYVYLASSTGLFRQHPDTSIWHKVSSFPGISANAVFVDRMNRVFVAWSKKAYVSTNSGSTWNIDTTGLNVKDVLGLTGFCDDAFGNIYARSATGLWRSTAGTQPWARIDQTLGALAYDPSTNFLINNLSGDTLLYASTAFGSYISSDQGTTWMRDSSQFSASFIYGLGKTSAGRLLTSTNLGVYYKNPGDLQWTKTFPATGYLAASPVFIDGSGNAYTLGAKTNPSNFQSLRANWKSTDGGLTWNPDTAGIGALAGQNPTYYVDETGMQHYGAYDTPAKFYRKASGQSWTPDTVGYGIGTSDLPTAFGTDRHGFLYVATNSLSSFKGMVWKRPIAGGTWIPDTAGLAGTQVYWITADKNGVSLAGAISGLYRKNGATWTKLPAPPGLNGYSVFAVSADSSGYTVAGFSTLFGNNYFWRGLYATNNYGATWTYLGLDSISVRGLVSYGDTTYAYTYADGLFKVRSTLGVSSVGVITLPASFGLEQNYPNPFNPTTNVRFTIGETRFVSVKIYDVLGREVTTLVNEKMNPGSYNVAWNGGNPSSGVYFYQLRTGSFVETKKMVLMK